MLTDNKEYLTVIVSLVLILTLIMTSSASLFKKIDAVETVYMGNDLSSQFQHSQLNSTSQPYYFEKIQLSSNPITVKYLLHNSISKSHIFFSDALNLLKGENPILRAILISTFKEFPHSALFWECPPISHLTITSTNFQFVLIHAEALESITADPEAFSNKFQQNNNMILKFHNLGGDALLLVPRPLETVDSSAYAHLAKFIKLAPSSQIDSILIEVANSIIEQVFHDKTKKLWTSTSGLGVSWLHIRLDSYPKYYNWLEYKNA
eukprot:gene7837-16028_t